MKIAVLGLGIIKRVGEKPHRRRPHGALAGRRGVPQLRVYPDAVNQRTPSSSSSPTHQRYSPSSIRSWSSSAQGN